MDLLSLVILITAAGILAVVAWNVLAWPKVGPAGGNRPELSILIPARNEEENLPACLDAALAQGATVAEILVYDDHSTDATSQIIRDYAGRDGRVRGVVASDLPPGWCGKNFACAQLAEAAAGEWLLFLDADARLTGGAAARLLAEAGRRGVTFLSPWPGLELVGFWEKALMPLLNFVVFTLFPAPLSLVRRDAALGLGHGACLLMRRDAYFRVGGHAAVRDQIFEDTRLAQAWRARGERGLCLDGQDVVRVRMYGSLGEIWRGFQKNFYPAFRREASFWAFLIFHTSIFLAPFVAVNVQLLAAAGCGLLARALLALRFGHTLWAVLLHPAAEIMLIALGLSSWWRCRTGRGVQWKGRVYQGTGEG